MIGFLDWGRVRIKIRIRVRVSVRVGVMCNVRVYRWSNCRRSKCRTLQLDGDSAILVLNGTSLNSYSALLALK